MPIVKDSSKRESKFRFMKDKNGKTYEPEF